jgi:NADH-quinone oxidoreductase subunit N
MNALLVICGLGVLSLVAEILSLKKWLLVVIIAGLALSIILVVREFGSTTLHFSEMLLVDNFSVAYTGLICSITLLWFWMSRDYFNGSPHITDRSAMVLFSVAGALVMASFNNMAMLFLGIEILSISLYVLAGSRKESLFSTEAAFKYFLMGSFATGFLLMGIALVYGATGSFQITTIATFVEAHKNELPYFFHAGVLLMFAGLAFKISAAPFHFWAPDVYDGSPTVITALMSTVVKIAAVAAFYRIFSLCFSSVQETWGAALQVIMVLTLVIANVTAVYQNNVKRMLAYSSVGHVGYILLGFMANSTAAAGVIFYYLAAYAISSIAAFTVLYTLEQKRPNVTIEDFNGLYKRKPLLAVAMTIALLSLAGIPPLPGFFGKYMVFALAIQNGYTPLVIVAVITSLIGVYYYFRLIIAMYFKEPAGADIETEPSLTSLVYVLVVLTLALGIFPDTLLYLIK